MDDYIITKLTGDSEGDTVHDMYADGKAVINGGGANGVPAGVFIGRIWHHPRESFPAISGHSWGEWSVTAGDGDWSSLPWVHGFTSRAQGAVYLRGMRAGRLAEREASPVPTMVANMPVIAAVPLGHGNEYIVTVRQPSRVGQPAPMFATLRAYRDEYGGPWAGSAGRYDFRTLRGALFSMTDRSGMTDDITHAKA